jgi:hypothetical protein
MTSAVPVSMGPVMTGVPFSGAMMGPDCCGGGALPAPAPMPGTAPEVDNALRLTPVPGNTFAPRTPAGPSSRKGW